MNLTSEKSLCSYISYGYLEGINKLKNKFLYFEHSNDYIKTKNEDFIIFEKKFSLRKNLDCCVLKVYFYKKNYWKAGLDMGEVRLFRFVKNIFHSCDKKNSFSVAFFKNSFEEYAIKINNIILLRVSLLGKKNRKKFLIDNIESHDSSLTDDPFTQSTAIFLDNDFFSLDYNNLSTDEVKLISLFSKINGVILERGNSIMGKNRKQNVH